MTTDPKYDTHRKLTDKEKAMLRLIFRSADKWGWATVSESVLPLVKELPSELVCLIQNDSGVWKVCLTSDGAVIVNWML